MSHLEVESGFPIRVAAFATPERKHHMGSDSADFTRIPGLYLAWDFALLLEAGQTYLIEDGGRTADGQALYMVFGRPDEAGREVRRDPC